MASSPNSKTTDIKVTVEGGEFYAFVKATKRAYRVGDLDEVVMTLGGGKLTIQTARTGCVLARNQTTPVVAHLRSGDVCRLASLITDSKASGRWRSSSAPP
ncbi:MAG: hypothetical protein ACLQM8_00480 [Limisphaerales bacterium]